MNEEQQSARINHILGGIWREICSYSGRGRWVRPGRIPQRPVAAKNPPQVVENRKIIGVLVWRRIALYSAGKGLAEKGNTLGKVKHRARANRAARGLPQKHLTKEREGRVRRPKGAAAG